MSEKARSLQGSVRPADRLVRAAKKCQRLASQFAAADLELKELMHDRYGDHDEMPDEIVEITQYGSGGQKVTIRWMDSVMTEAGYPPNPKLRDAAPITPTNTDHDQTH